MKKYILIILCLSIINISSSIAQDNSLIDQLNYILFEDMPQETLEYSFYCNFEDKDYNRTVRYKDLRGERIAKVCEAIRLSKDHSLIPDLTTILLKQEGYFLDEWEVAWKDGGGPKNIFDDQYELLVDIDITISFLTMEKEQWDNARKYAYLKNLYLLNQGDYDKSRVENTLYISDYIRNVRNGFCASSLFLPSTSKRTLIDQMSEFLLEEILQDLSKTDVSKLGDGEKKFYNIGLRKTLITNKDSRIDAFLIEHAEFFNGLDFLKARDNTHLSIYYYHLLLDRYMLNNQNSDLLIPIADDLFKNSNATEINKVYFSLFASKGKADASQILVDRLSTKIIEAETKDAQKYMQLSIDILSNADELKLEQVLMKANSPTVNEYHKLINKPSDN